jgi:hypothetical protein
MKESFSVGSKWFGVCCYQGSDHYPFKMLILKNDGRNIEGTITWPTLQHSKTKFKGDINYPVVGVFSIKEYEVCFCFDFFLKKIS